MNNTNIGNFIVKARLLGCSEYVDVCDGKSIEVIHKLDYNHVIYIPKQITTFNSWDRNRFSYYIRKLSGDVKIVGGENLFNDSNILRKLRLDRVNI